MTNEMINIIKQTIVDNKINLIWKRLIKN